MLIQKEVCEQGVVMGGLGTQVGDAGGASGKCDHPPTDSVQGANVRRYCARRMVQNAWNAKYNVIILLPVLTYPNGGCLPLSAGTKPLAD